MKKTTLITLLLLLLFVQSKAQTVTGRIVDSEKQSVVMATIALQTLDSINICATTADADGRFVLTADSIPLPFRLIVSSIGYETVMPECASYAVGDVVLATKTNVLGDVVVKSKRPILNVQGDRIVADASSIIKSRIAISDDIRVFGKQGVIIALNDRVISYKQLKEIPTSMIERIELEQQAPSEYVSGGVKPPLLRVVLRNEPGLLGSVGLSSWYCMDESWALTETANALLSLGKFSLLNNFSNTNGFWRDGIKQDVFYADHETHQKAESRQKLKRSLQNDLNMRYSFTPYDHIDVNASYSTHKESGKLLNTGDVALFNEHGHDSNYGNGVSVKMVKGLKKDGVSKVSVKGSYSESHFKEDRKYDAFSSGVQLMDIDNGRYNADISTILTYAIGRSHSLKAGVNYNRISELNSYKKPWWKHC